MYRREVINNNYVLDGYTHERFLLPSFFVKLLAERVHSTENECSSS